VRDDGGSGQRDEERGRVLRLSARLPESLFHDLVQLGAYAEAAVAVREVDPCESGVEAVAAKGDVVHRLGVVIRQKRVEGGFDLGQFAVGGCGAHASSLPFGQQEAETEVS